MRSSNENYQLWEFAPSGWSPEDPQPSDSRTYNGELLFEASTLAEVVEYRDSLPEGWEFAYFDIRYPKSYVAPVVNWYEENSDIPF
jgi:hypothetical protein